MTNESDIFNEHLFSTRWLIANIDYAFKNTINKKRANMLTMEKCL